MTSNADSGPGTLREALALAAANGSATQDVIQFNLSNLTAAGRTILLQSQLPDLSSNLVIDGTTQAGAVFGQSNAHVEISTPNNYVANPNGYIAINTLAGQNINNVEIYGLYIYDYYDIVISYPDLKPRNGISLTNCTNITIGAANKGNLIRGFNRNCIDLESSDNIKIQNNVVGLNDVNTLGNGYDGGANNVTSGFINIVKCNHILFGGGPAEGNTVFVGINLTFYEKTSNVVSITSNNFAVFQDGVSTVFVLPELYRQLVIISTSYEDNMNFNQWAELASNDEIDISNNVTTGQTFYFNFINGTVNLTNNYFNIARNGVTDITYAPNSPSMYSEPIVIAYCNAQFNIGTNDPAKRNFFNNIENGVAVLDDPNVFLRYNDFKCVTITPYSNTIPPDAYTIPSANIAGVTTTGSSTTVNGTATPNSVIDIYSSESCRSQCSIRSYIQTVNADNTGKWTATIQNLNGIFYVSATLGNQTSLFQTFSVNTSNINIQNLRCTNMAMISGLTVPSGLSYYWVDETGNIVSHDLILQTNKPGKYQLILGDGCIKSDYFEIDDDRLVIYDNSLLKTDVSCGNNNGAINNLFVYDPLSKISSEVWTDAGGNSVGNTVNISNLSPGSYTLTVKTSDGCTTTYGPVIIKNVSGPNIDQSKITITPTNCGQSTGSITGMIVTGNGVLKYRWINGQQQQVSSDKDLINQPAGIYKLEVTDDSQCGTIFAADEVIPETNGITLDETSVQIVAASCSKNNGSVTGVKTTGATQFQWKDASGQLVATTADLINAVAGDYILTASNTFGCSKTSQSYHIGLLPATVFPTFSITTTAACNNQQNGSIVIATDPAISAYRWVNSQGATVSNNPALNNVVAGVYQLYLTDQNGCENFYKSYTVDQIPVLNFTQGTAQVANDHCTLKAGNIKNIQVSGGLPPYSYTWVNASGETIATTADISNLTAGDYTLTVKDASNCGSIAASYSILDQEIRVPSPSANNITLCSSGEAFLLVNNPSTDYKYRLYQNESDPTPLDEQASGSFKINIQKNGSYYITALSGTCESLRTQVLAVVGISALNIPNAFSPNGDGINDYWKIVGIENSPEALVQVFTRYGQKVFESRGYPQNFDGTSGGRQLPAGAYYYVITFGKNCNILSGSLTIIR